MGMPGSETALEELIPYKNFTLMFIYEMKIFIYEMKIFIYEIRISHVKR
jgi:hypothetical protein